MTILDRLKREYLQLSCILRTLRRLRQVKPETDTTAADIIEHWAREKPDNIAIYFENRRYSYRDYDRAGNQYARWAEAQGIARGQTVALVMENRPEYLFACLGLAKIGAVVSLININQRGDALAHSLNIAGARHVILGAELASAWAQCAAQVKGAPEIWTTGGVIAGTHDLDIELSCRSPEPLDPALRAGMVAKDRYLQVFTSGTTGLPKAANISHFRYFFIANSFASFAKARESDRIYVVLPLYHSSGGIAAVGTTHMVGGAVVLRRHFSASQFWDDCVRYEATLFQYIGELCRYLLNCPPHPLERQHKLRSITGNGLRPEIWRAFKERFAIPRIIEFYGATEGNVSLVNADGTPGAVGRVPPYLKSLFPVKVIKFDVEKSEPLRGADGFCIEAGADEIGETVGQIIEASLRARFEGYSDKAATEKKILRNAFETGDAWFRTGDLMRRDADGYFYFVDRIGDTFRWKGENVATSEVQQVLSTFPAIKEANVYGVHIPGTEGRAGMAAISVDLKSLDLNGLHQHIERNLPVYARPLFLRLQDTIEATGTFKQKKGDLVTAGFDPDRITDQIYFDHPTLRGYVPVDPALYSKIMQGELRL